MAYYNKQLLWWIYNELQCNKKNCDRWTKYMAFTTIIRNAWIHVRLHRYSLDEAERILLPKGTAISEDTIGETSLSLLEINCEHWGSQKLKKIFKCYYQRWIVRFRRHQSNTTSSYSSFFVFQNHSNKWVWYSNDDQFSVWINVDMTGPHSITAIARFPSIFPCKFSTWESASKSLSQEMKGN